MNKNLKRAGCFLCLATMIGSSFSFVACGGTGGTSIDPNKKQVWVSVFNGGFGDEWVQKTVDEFNLTHTETQFLLTEPNKDVTSKIEMAIMSGTTEADVFFACESSVQSMMRRGALMDLSNVLSSKPDGESGKTVAEKMKAKDLFKQVYSYNDTWYALPFNESMAGYIYDHDLFLEEGFLLTQQDGITLTLGKDGKPNTYDDGLPVTMEEWDYMLTTIRSSGIYPFIYSNNQSGYTSRIVEGLWEQYDGTENYEISYDYEGTYVKPSTGEEVSITPETGYLVAEMEGREKALEFLENYATDKNRSAANAYVHPSSDYTTTDHRIAQDKFVGGYKGRDSGDPNNMQIAMIAEGVWWENEARPMFNSLVEEGEVGQEYGTRDFRFMILPNFEGQKGIDGNGHGTVMAGGEHGAIFAKAQTDPVKIKAIEEFLAYVHSDAILKRCLIDVNCIRPFDLTLSNDEFKQLTKFGQNAWTIYNDTENIAINRAQAGQYISELTYLPSVKPSRWTVTMGAGTIHHTTYVRPIYAVEEHTVAECMQAYITGYKEDWKNIWDSYQSAIK